VTTIDQENTAEVKYLGDCIVHLTHHEMGEECWHGVIQFYSDNFEHPLVTADEKDPTGMVNQALVNFYKLEYEQRLLTKFMRTGEL
jgi:hypothetical protein